MRSPDLRGRARPARHRPSPALRQPTVGSRRPAHGIIASPCERRGVLAHVAAECDRPSAAVEPHPSGLGGRRHAPSVRSTAPPLRGRARAAILDRGGGPERVARRNRRRRPRRVGPAQDPGEGDRGRGRSGRSAGTGNDGPVPNDGPIRECHCGTPARIRGASGRAGRPARAGGGHAPSAVPAPPSSAREDVASGGPSRPRAAASCAPRGPLRPADAREVVVRT